MKDERLQHAMKLSEKMINDWNREDLMTFAWDRLSDELVNLSNNSFNKICEQYSLPYNSGADHGKSKS